jgi:hypothetical protein
MSVKVNYLYGFKKFVLNLSDFIERTHKKRITILKCELLLYEISNEVLNFISIFYSYTLQQLMKFQKTHRDCELLLYI